MTQHICPRCGHEDSCGYGTWPDRHPALATIGALFTLTFMGMMFSVYPIAATAMTALGAIGWRLRAAGRDKQRRAALAARADYEHARLMARSTPQPIRLLQPAPAHPPAAPARMEQRTTPLQYR
ncbi:hypothetical protein [Mycolicibacterium sp. 050158]|uniref:hypothetical protein n=1 Tax=Mycolicibacterium sp. 050158 TaxID=3090602 RepID=UPI00299D7C6F|nr:hypothetical protein [Mycolicibacterium sp. 050158]MDX1888875.1 hypothetical protein [Mycolicibacterium sp. 050158]